MLSHLYTSRGSETGGNNENVSLAAATVSQTKPNSPEHAGHPPQVFFQVHLVDQSLELRSHCFLHAATTVKAVSGVADYNETTQHNSCSDLIRWALLLLSPYLYMSRRS